MHEISAMFLEVKKITSNKDGKEYRVGTFLYQDKFGYKLLDVFLKDDMLVKAPRLLSAVVLKGFWHKKDEKWSFNVMEVA